MVLTAKDIQSGRIYLEEKGTLSNRIDFAWDFYSNTKYKTADRKEALSEHYGKSKLSGRLAGKVTGFKQQLDKLKSEIEKPTEIADKSSNNNRDHRMKGIS
ncbi:MAG: hypothetical protein K0U24_00350 [Gammaproteobacteria bacterium]|nr:hypothetical protein [Gammaproteobacteria bacterium]MCH9762678.1 hypothetical protein [Gammaproteobacteria bacterium]